MYAILFTVVTLGQCQQCPNGMFAVPGLNPAVNAAADAFFAPPGGVPAISDLTPWWVMPDNTQEEHKAREAARLKWYKQQKMFASMQETQARKQRIKYKRATGYYDRWRNGNADTITALQRLWFYQMNLPYPYASHNYGYSSYNQQRYYQPYQRY